MALYRPKNVPLNWYQYDVSFSIELIRSYIEGVESLAAESIKRYEEEKVEIILEEVPEEDYVRAIERYRGLDDESWDLDGVFKVKLLYWMDT